MYQVVVLKSVQSSTGMPLRLPPPPGRSSMTASPVRSLRNSRPASCVTATAISGTSSWPEVTTPYPDRSSSVAFVSTITMK